MPPASVPQATACLLHGRVAVRARHIRAELRRKDVNRDAAASVGARREAFAQATTRWSRCAAAPSLAHDLHTTACQRPSRALCRARPASSTVGRPPRHRAHHPRCRDGWRNGLVGFATADAQLSDTRTATPGKPWFVIAGRESYPATYLSQPERGWGARVTTWL